MSDELKEFLTQLPLRGAPPSLRQQVLNVVARELTAQSRARWRRWTGPALAAGVLLAVALDIGLEKTHEARLAEIYGPPPMPRGVHEMTRTIEKLTDKQTASKFEHDLLVAARWRQSSVSKCENYWTAYVSQMQGKE